MFIGIGANLDILDTAAHNPIYNTSDPGWAKKVCSGNTWLSLGGSSPKFEWAPVLDPGQAAESRTVALSGVVIAQEDSSEDVWFTHPFSLSADASKGHGGDWDLDVAWASNPNYDYLAAPALKDDHDTDIRNGLARDTGLPDAKAMHIETDAQFIQGPYRAAKGDKVVIFGRWIVDCGHDIYQSEIHPPLLFAKAEVGTDGISTISTVIGRPFLVSQTFDGRGLLDYAVKLVGDEAAKSLAPPFPGALILGDKLRARTAVETKPFTGLQWMIYYVRPPRPAQLGQVPQVTYHFKVRSGVVVELFDTRDGRGTIGVSVLLNDIQFKPTILPKLVTWTVPLNAIKSYDDLDTKLDVALFGAVAIGNLPMAGLIEKGVSTEWYGLPPIVEAPDTTVLASSLAQNTTMFLDDTQPFPVAGGLTVRWVNNPIPGSRRRP